MMYQGAFIYNFLKNLCQQSQYKNDAPQPQIGAAARLVCSGDLSRSKH